MPTSPVILQDTMAGPLSIGTQCATPSTSTGIRSPGQIVEDDNHISSYSTWKLSSSLLLSPLLPEDEAHWDNNVYESELTESPDSRLLRPPTVPPHAHLSPSTQLNAAIPASQYTYNYTKSQDVRSLVNSSASLSTSTATRSDGYPPTPLKPTVSSFSGPSNNVITQPIYSLRTPSTPVFQSTKDLAAHYGIPQILPPAPRTTPLRAPIVSQSPPVPDFSTLSSNYLSMLSQKPTDNTMSAAADSTTTVSPADLHAPVLASEQDMQNIIDVILASPEFRMSHDFNDSASTMAEYLTSPMPPTPLHDFDSSPMDDSPFSDFLTTPVMGYSEDMLTSPLLDSGDMNVFGGMPLFPSYEPVAASPVVAKAQTDAQPNFENMYTMSPAIDSVDPSSLYPSPRLPFDKSSFPAPAPAKSVGTRRKSSATGTRKNITPEALIDLEAPTQKRVYATPSATSRKEVPAIFAKKRARSVAFGDDEEDELAEEPLPPNATEKQQIEWKRRQNTLAARKSRKRKLQHQQELEDTVNRLTRERDQWKVRAVTMQQIMQSHGLPAMQFDETE